jgi:rubredoxin
MAERISLSGGWMTTQELRDMVGWAGAAGAEFLAAGDRQDWRLEGPSPGRLPPRLSVRPTGSLQSSAYGNPPSAALPWLTTGVWMDLLAQIPLPPELDVQLLHDGARAHFIRWGHVRLIAQRAAHRWAVALRRPGTTRLLAIETPFETGSIPALIQTASEAWSNGDESFWQGTPLSEAPPTPTFPTEGFHDETSATFAFGFWSPARFRVEHLRDLAWLAWDSGAHRVWLTPDRVLLVQGVPQKHRGEWEQWLARTRLPARHGDVARSVRCADSASSAPVAAHLHAEDRLPFGGAITVADEALNRGDGVCGPFPVVIGTAHSWLFRSADGARSGEGTLAEVLEALGKRTVGEETPRPSPIITGHRCSSCLTVYEPAIGDPRGGVSPDTPFEALPPTWECPVCGGPHRNYIPLAPNALAIP